MPRSPAEPADRLEESLRKRPELGALFVDYYHQLWADRVVDAVLLELCRLRIATLLGDRRQQMIRDRSALDAGLTEEKIAELSRYPTSPLYSARERACLDYTELHVIDVHSITDADAERVKTHLTDEEFVGFSVAIGLLEGVGRLRLTLDASGPVPDHPIVVASPGSQAASSDKEIS